MRKLVTVAAFQFVAEAELMQSALADRGIASYLADDNLIAMDWLMSNAVGGVKLQVAKEDESIASDVVAGFESSRRRPGKLEAEPIKFPCENCGRQIQFPAHRRGGVETCPHCGRYVDVPEEE